MTDQQDKPRCETCWFWHDPRGEDNDFNGDDMVGWCRRFPPTIPSEDSRVPDYPLTRAGDWCGEWRTASEQEEQAETPADTAMPFDVARSVATRRVKQTIGVRRETDIVKLTCLLMGQRIIRGGDRWFLDEKLRGHGFHQSAVDRLIESGLVYTHTDESTGLTELKLAEVNDLGRPVGQPAEPLQ